MPNDEWKSNENTEEQQGQPEYTAHSEVSAIEAEPATTNTFGSALTPITEPVFVQQPFEKKSKRKPLIIAVSILILLLAGLSSVFAYNSYQSPEKVVADAAVKLITARAASYNGQLLYSWQENKSSLAIDFDGKADRANNAENATFTFTTNDKSYKLKGSYIQNENLEFYFKIENAKKTLEAYAQEGEDIPAAAMKFVEKIDARWIKVTLDDVTADNEEASKSQKCIAKVVKELKQDDAAFEEIAKLYKQHAFVTAKNDLSYKNGNLEFDVAVDNAKLSAFTTGLNKTAVLQRLQKCDKEAYTVKPQEVDEETEKAENKTQLHIAVSQWTHELRELKSTYKDDNASGDFSIRPTFHNEISIEKPRDAMSFEELQKLIEQMQNELYPSS